MICSSTLLKKKWCTWEPQKSISRLAPPNKLTSLYNFGVKKFTHLSTEHIFFGLSSTFGTQLGRQRAWKEWADYIVSTLIIFRLFDTKEATGREARKGFPGQVRFGLYLLKWVRICQVKKCRVETPETATLGGKRIKIIFGEQQTGWSIAKLKDLCSNVVQHRRELKFSESPVPSLPCQ